MADILEAVLVYVAIALIIFAVLVVWGLALIALGRYTAQGFRALRRWLKRGRRSNRNI